MRFIVILCASLLSGCATIADINPDGASAHYKNSQLARACAQDGGQPCNELANYLKLRNGKGRSHDAASPIPNYDAAAVPSGLQSYWSPQTGPVTCNTFGVFTTCN